ncbi:hypothetical protein DWV00_13130 [Trinickia dinghuensis]|uniref:Uncharacterized protein n=1 Tax=Trinickia dinghuensis TaxID=2291023 RepID=A0A3D8JZ17_9BURK|nr:hypothetical protein DWV00_13130 [Trinickia dinghuensis]
MSLRATTVAGAELVLKISAVTKLAALHTPLHCVSFAAIAMRAPLADDDGTLRRWIDAATVDPLPEVRYALVDRDE